MTTPVNNSSSCKTWCITFVSALLVVIVDKGKVSYVWIALIPIFAIYPFYITLTVMTALAYILINP